MVRRFRLRPLSEGSSSETSKSGGINRREFMRLSFNTAAGLITLASLGSVGFASFLMGQKSRSSSDTAIKILRP